IAAALVFAYFFFNDPATTEIYTLSLHDALPISIRGRLCCWRWLWDRRLSPRSEEHTSELQSLTNLVCRLLLEKKKKPHRRSKALHKTYPLHRSYEAPTPK